MTNRGKPRLFLVNRARKVVPFLTSRQAEAYEALNMVEAFAIKGATQKDLSLARQVAQIAEIETSNNWDGEYINEYSDRFFAAHLIFCACIENHWTATSFSNLAIDLAINGPYYHSNPTKYISKFTLIK